MSISKRTWGNGKQAWEACIMINKKKHRQQFPTRKEADAYEQEIRGRLAAGTFRAEGARLTISVLAPDFRQFLSDRKNIKGRMREEQLRGRLGQLENYILASRPVVRRRGQPLTFQHGLANMKLGDLTTYVVEKFQDNVLRSGISVKTTIEVMGTLSLFFEFAKKQGYVSVNNVKALDKDARPVREKKEVIPPTPTLVRAIIAAAEPIPALQIKFAALTALRASEEWAVRWKHIDFAARNVWVRTRVKDGKEGKTKTRSSVRKVPLSGELLESLRTWRAVSPHPNDNDLVFHEEGGGFVSHDKIREHVFYRLFEEVMEHWPANIERPLRPRWHDLRHFAASCWILGGLNIKAIQKYLGHAQIQTTMDTYGHLFPDQDDSPFMDRVAAEVLGTGKSVGANLAQAAPTECPTP